jgi:hypothetical protein
MVAVMGNVMSKPASRIVLGKNAGKTAVREIVEAVAIMKLARTITALLLPTL